MLVAHTPKQIKIADKSVRGVFDQYFRGCKNIMSDRVYPVEWRWIPTVGKMIDMTFYVEPSLVRFLTNSIYLSVLVEKDGKVYRLDNVGRFAVQIPSDRGHYYDDHTPEIDAAIKLLLEAYTEEGIEFID